MVCEEWKCGVRECESAQGVSSPRVWSCVRRRGSADVAQVEGISCTVLEGAAWCCMV